MGKSNLLNNRRFVTKDQLASWLDDFSKSQTIIAPRDVSGIILYRPIKKSTEIVEHYSRPVLSIKEAFFPPTEELFSVKRTDTEVHLHETLSKEKTIIFGVRPCDSLGIKLLDALFTTTSPVDPYYAARRENSTILGMACNEMSPSCFCTSVGGSPDDPSNMDVMFYPFDNGYEVEAISKKGSSLIADVDWKFRKSDGIKGELQTSIKVLDGNRWPEFFNEDYWARVSERCLSCRACAYVCPTCRCFVIRDEVVKSREFQRIRCWDSCAGENYRLVAGGHKPRAEKGERLRNRFFCKFYYFPEQYGLGNASACTGCGRCIDVCPAGVDITEVLMDLEKQG